MTACIDSIDGPAMEVPHRVFIDTGAQLPRRGGNVKKGHVLPQDSFQVHFLDAAGLPGPGQHPAADLHAQSMSDLRGPFQGGCAGMLGILQDIHESVSISPVASWFTHLKVGSDTCRTSEVNKVEAHMINFMLEVRL